MKNILLLVLTIALFSCNNQGDNTEHKALDKEENTSVTNHEEHKHWTYAGETGPEHWAEIEKQSDCDGKSQSPINIIDTDAVIDASLKPLDIHYSNNVKILEVKNNGHSIEYEFEKGDYIMLGDEKYELIQIHFHEASEHTINGVHYPLEMHMVHLGKDNKIAVLAVMAIEGESSQPFTFLDSYLPVKKGASKEINTTFDLNQNLPVNKEYYTYKGSLTTPPCSETVTWFVFKTPITVSLEQVKIFQELMPLNNYRDEQELNGRIVQKYVQH